MTVYISGPIATIPIINSQISTTYNINNSNLINYYPFNNDMYDYASGSGVNNATTLSATISTTNTVLTNGSLYLPGEANETFKLPNITFTNNGITIAGWIKMPAAQPSSGWTYFFTLGNNYRSTAIERNFCLAFPNGGGALTFFGHQLSLGIDTNGTASTYTGYTDYKWHHYCLTVTSTGTMKIYVDNTDINFSYTAYPSLSQFTFVTLGAQSDYSWDANITAYFNQFVIFNRVLTATERSNLYNYPTKITFTNNPSSS